MITAAAHTLALADAVPGQRLAEAVLDDHGQLLVGAGCELTTPLLQALARRGVAELSIAHAAAAEPAEPDDLAEPAEAVTPAARHAHAAERIAHLFRHATQQGRLNPLMHSVLQYRLEGVP